MRFSDFGEVAVKWNQDGSLQSSSVPIFSLNLKEAHKLGNFQETKEEEVLKSTLQPTALREKQEAMLILSMIRWTEEYRASFMPFYGGYLYKMRLAVFPLKILKGLR